ncbi:MAG: MBL fold metallo-hydrolase [Pegethrix bostrychoides GSE-TBD4-15B]|jgi:glyoxylase-like metal-dependent hydrolase (beta-lactamase superfamily II)|uniref:MBL fold metallo-hydrolase n=1 Tax=Pegethrix bostrychoides GSE-TBD4-15B TaxID=2839662 RepID=A0A951PD87_9CYAN|nr:MBL fold metallo-hydrolase [Pegethrix bostrychoides GSE-TBD4-15B]
MNQSASPSASSSASKSGLKPPRQRFKTIFAFAPNRQTLGGTAYLLQEPAANILVDCPAWNAETEAFLTAQGGVDWLFLTHRGGRGSVKEIQQAFGAKILVQEQEAYLLPGLSLITFEQEFQLSPSSQAIWTCGHSPGSACLYHQNYGGVLFSGRHLLPNAQAAPVPLRLAKTFHWPRQIRSIQALRQRFSPETLRHICPGANTGFLRGRISIEPAYPQLAALDLEACLQTQPSL